MLLFAYELKNKKMSPETPSVPQNPEAPRRQSRRELVQDVGKIAASSIVAGSVMGVLAAEGKRKAELRSETQASEKESREIDELLVYIDDLCDNPSNIPWIPEDQFDQIAAYSSVGFSEYYAEKAGFTLLDTEEAIFAIEHAQSLDELIEAFDVWTRQFGATATVADNWQFPKNIPLSPAEGQSELGMLQFRFRTMIEQLASVPKELFELSGVTNIHFTEFTSSDVKAASGAQTVTHAKAWMDGEGKMAMSLDTLYLGHANEFTLLHEIGHLLDERLQGGLVQSYGDSRFDGLNDPDFEYYGLIPDGVEYDGFIRDYSAYDVLEDKAVIYENMLSGVDFNLAQSEDPILQKKYRLLLARLEYHLPSSAPYLILHGYRGDLSPRNPYGAVSDNPTIAVA